MAVFFFKYKLTPIFWKLKITPVFQGMISYWDVPSYTFISLIINVYSNLLKLYMIDTSYLSMCRIYICQEERKKGIWATLLILSFFISEPSQCTRILKGLLHLYYVVSKSYFLSKLFFYVKDILMQPSESNEFWQNHCWSAVWFIFVCFW